ncbi:pH-responsive protein 2 [[Candida] anglica]|uniref:1,3-beta-glucanosyltransferase n=1 Tax=[Candida] anglica TaxID=148631 RepID=A0ABP0ECU6_9ASCO
MLFKSLLSTAIAAAGFISSASAADLPAIEISGNKFFYSNNGTQFLIKGVAYQQNPTNLTADESFVDPLADGEACKRDVPLLAALDTNVIRVYALNTSQDHTTCMNLLQDAGIYVIADLSEPDLSINRDSPEWNLDLYDRYTSVVDLFHNYTNILGFFAGNEVTNDKTNTDASAFVKAAVRDTKAYIKAKGYRSIPVGYSANDDTDIRVDLVDYFACGSEEDRADFFGINMYEWCGSSSYTLSGYSTISKQYQNAGIPLFFSEYGCNKVTPRQFQEVGTIYGPDMLNIWSGGIVYMYFQEENDYGLVTVDGKSVSTLADYTNLKSQLAKISPSLATSTASVSASVTSCPTGGSGWAASTNLPPTPDQEICDCMQSSLDCIVNSKISSDDYQDLFAYVCDQVSCEGITGNGTTGDYGSYSPCSNKARLDFVLNLYYNENGGGASNCDFSGSATLQQAATASSCNAILKSAGTSGLGTVSGHVQTTGSDATTTGSSGSKSSSGSQSSGTSSSSKKNAGVQQAGLNSFTKVMWGAISMVLGAGFVFM